MDIKNEEIIFENLLKIENELKLFEKEINGVFFWKLIRTQISKKLYTFSKNKTNTSKDKKKLSDRISKIKSIFFNNLNYSVFNNDEKVDVLVFENPRKLKNEFGRYYDPYSYYYINKLKENNDLKYQIIDDGYLGEHFEEASEIRKFTESVYYDIFYKKFLKMIFNLENKPIITELDSKINNTFGINLNIKKIIYGAIRSFKFQEAKFGKILDIKKSKEIYIVCSYGKEGIINAAKKRNIKVIEFQHGIMGKLHLGYNFPKNIDIPYFPDKLVLFGKYWKNITNLPISDIEYFGFPHLTNKISKYKNIKKNKNQILIVSQLSVSNKLIEKTLKLAKQNPDFEFIYRLHPKEKKDWEIRYPLLKECSLNNIKIDDSTDDLYKVIAMSEYLIGVNSTVIYESLLLDAKVILLDINGVGFMRYLIDSQIVMKIDNDGNLEFRNLNLNFKLVDKNYLFERYTND